MIKHTTTSSEYRELKASFEALQKDVNKKEARNEALMKDLVSIRTSAANQQVRSCHFGCIHSKGADSYTF
jgi:hypothetical protein